MSKILCNCKRDAEKLILTRTTYKHQDKDKNKHLKTKIRIITRFPRKMTRTRIWLLTSTI